VFVFAPNIAHRQWIEDELPYWLPTAPWRGFFYTSGKFSTKGEQRALREALETPYSFVTMNYEAVMSPNAHNWMKKFFRKRGVLYVLDESTAIKSASAKRTHRIVCSGRWCDYRRILTGTPATNHPPFDVYKQIQFLDWDFWKRHGFLTYEEYKTFFGVWDTPGRGTARNKKTGQLYEYNYPRLRRDTDNVPLYRNLDKLQAILATISSRVLKDDVFDLPPKLHIKQYFEPSTEQQRVYNELRAASMAFLSSGRLITTPLAITRLLRLQQVLSNYMPTDSGEPFELIDKRHHPRLDSLVAIVEQVAHQALVWARFHRDVDLIMDALGEKSAIRADGVVTGEQRARALRAFKSGDVQFLVSNPACRGVSRAQNLQMARSSIYYNNTFSLEDRKQSEDRPHRSGTKHSVDYIDIVAPETVDVQILQSLRNNHDVASRITGDVLKEWL
jgi:hypothetical protein